MLRIGHGASRLIAALSGSALRASARAALAPRSPWVLGWGFWGAVAAAVPALWMWGFTVDDALISVRYARHLALGLGWRFDVHGPSTDGVTPLAWPLLLAPIAHADPMAVLDRARALGLVAWTGTGVGLGAAIGRVAVPRWSKAAALATLGLSVPVAAHAVSGMETAIATLLATTAAISAPSPRRVAILAGLAAVLRPEMAAWACVLAVGTAIAARAPVVRVATGAGLALAPFAICAVIRVFAWGSPAPLSVLAKPSDLDHGLAYAAAACVVTITPILVLAPLALRGSPVGLAIAVAAAVHAAAIAAVGGDWMPYARLMVPVAPSLAYAGVLAAARAHPLATGARSLSAIALGAALVARGGTSGRRVGADRAALIADARPMIERSACVAALDIGWVSAATEADIVDLAGVTDPEVAALPGGHTSKRVDAMFLLARRPDALLLYAPAGLPEGDIDRWRDARYGRVVEARLARDAVIARHFAPVAWVRLGAEGAGYVVLKARPTEDD
jgi:hypothetical protein